jgi:hypothetical protein
MYTIINEPQYVRRWTKDGALTVPHRQSLHSATDLAVVTAAVADSLHACR